MTQWLDQSGRGRDATSPAGSGPAYVPGALNGQPVVRFRFYDSLFIPPSQPTRYSVFVVGKNTGTNGSGDNLGFIFGGTNALLWLDPTSVWLDTPDGGHITTTIGPVNIYHELSLRYDGSTLAFYRDGNAQSYHAFQSSAAWSFGGIGWIGLGGDLAEIIIYDRELSGVEQAAVDTYLRNKYALPRCGDAVCNGAENLWTCPVDCSTCGDGICSGDESVWNCSQDCGFCGDGTCTSGEDRWNCPQDCNFCADPPCPI